jgi:hypothetical protein
MRHISPLRCREEALDLHKIHRWHVLEEYHDLVRFVDQAPLEQESDKRNREDYLGHKSDRDHDRVNPSRCCHRSSSSRHHQCRLLSQRFRRCRSTKVSVIFVKKYINSAFILFVEFFKFLCRTSFCRIHFEIHIQETICTKVICNFGHFRSTRRTGFVTNVSHNITTGNTFVTIFLHIPFYQSGL